MNKYDKVFVSLFLLFFILSIIFFEIKLEKFAFYSFIMIFVIWFLGIITDKKQQ